MFMLLYNRALKHPTALSYPDLLDWQRNSRSFEQIAAFTGQGFDLSSPGTPEHLDGMAVSSNFFTTLGVKLALDREFSPVEDKAGGPPAAVISHHLWEDRFRGSPSAIGTAITLSGLGYTVVGVLPPGFRFYQGADVYTAIGRGDPLQRKDRTIHNIAAIGRLKPGMNLGQALAELNIVQQHIDDLNPATERGQATYVVPLKLFLAGNVTGTLLLLLGAVGLVLLIACANIANLLLARSTSRQREFAVRMALGASRGQILRQLITEALLLSLTGGVLGLCLAAWGVQPALAILGDGLPRIQNIHTDVSVLVFTFGISIVVGVLFGLLPGLKSSQTDLQTGLKEAGRGLAGRHHRTQSVLVVVQIALAVVLLAGGSLLVRTIRNLWAVNPGFETQHLLTFQIGLSPSALETPARTRNAYRALLEKIREAPGVEAAALTALVPLDQNDNSGPFWIGSRQPASMAELPRALYYFVGPDYQKTMKMPLLRGRFLSRADTSDSERVVVIDDLLARRYFHHTDAVGQTMMIPHWGSVRVVGVVGHVQQQNLAGSDP